MMFATIAAVLAGALLASDPFHQPPAVDPGVRAVVERFFAAQEAEDAEAYLALWSSRAQKPRPEQLKFVFDTGDDRFSSIVIDRVTRIGDLRRVRLTVTRERTSARPRADGTRPVSTGARRWSLTLVQEGPDLKILSEGLPADDLAGALVAAPTPEARETLLASEPELLNARLLAALTRRADALAQVQQYSASLAIYERVLEVARRIGNAKAEGEALQNIGNAYYFQRDFPNAIRSYDDRVTLERAHGNPAGLASAIMGVATTRYSLFEYGDALPAYREALVLYEQLGDDAGAASALLSTGNVLYLQGDLAAAVADYGRSRDLYTKTFNTDGAARALDGLGRVHTARGNYAAALEAFAGVLEEGRARGNRVMQANASFRTGEVHLRLANFSTARAAFDASRLHYEAAGDPASVGRAWQGIALADLSAARFAPAEDAYLKSRSACGTAQDADCVARAIMGLAFAQFSQEHHDKAIASYREAAAAFTALNKIEEVTRAEVGLSQAHFGKKDYPAAAAAAAGAVERAPVKDVVWRARVAEARALRQMDDPGAAMASVLEAVRVVQEMMRAALERPSDRVPRDTASAYALLAVLQAEAGDAAATLATVEQRRAHALRLALSTNERDIVRHMTPEERTAEREAANRVGSLQAQIDRERDLPKPDLARIGRLETELVGAVSARARQQARMFELWPDLRVWRGLAPAVTPDDVSPLLEGGAAIVELVIDDDDLLAVTAVQGEQGAEYRAHVVQVGRQTLAERIAAVNDPAALRDIVQWRVAAAPLVRTLPVEVLDVIASASRVILVPDDVLWRVPFEALPVKDRFVADFTEITYAGSLNALVRPDALPEEQPVLDAAVPLLAIAAPDLSEDRRRRVTNTAPDWHLRDPDAAVREAELLFEPQKGKDPPGNLLTAVAATEAAFRASAGAARALHIAAPVRLSSASPLFSPVLLSDPPTATLPAGDTPPAPPDTVTPADSAASTEPARPAEPADDGVLEAREVMNLDLRADVAVLSDGVALAMRDAAASLGTLQWVWRAAGVPSLVVGRWAADEDASAALLADFHARVQKGEAPAAALQAARSTIRNASATSAPWFWAQWMIVGR